MNFGSNRMTTVIDIDRRAHSRRELLGNLALVLGGAALLTAVAGPAAAKVGPQDVGYQPTPKGAARCDNCLQWQAPNACKVVSGKISPTGWCSIYARKG
jgi:hypothetical protein